MKVAAAALLLALSIDAAGSAQAPAAPPAASAARTNIPYADAKPILDVLRKDLLPPELRTAPSRETAWSGWVSRRDAEIRARLARGDEDSILNFLLLGTTFTTRARVTDLARLRAPGPALDLVHSRLDDLLTALASPDADERLRLVRDVVQRTGINPVTADGRPKARLYVLQILDRVIAETEEYARAAAAMNTLDDPMAQLALDATLYQHRGLSSDTSLIPNYAVDSALQDLAVAGRLAAGRVRRVAIIGPGLDFIDRRDGHDFYPVQTIQPFAVVDSLMRLGLAAPDLRVTTLDVSTNINRHLEGARRRAGSGAYVLQLALGTSERWHPDLVGYWKGFGQSVGTAVEAAVPPRVDGGVRVRAIQVRPAVVASIVPQDVNVVLQRLEPLSDDDRFDLVIATNILIYYDVFEQQLTSANVAKMLRPGGLFLSNNLIVELPASPMSLVAYTDVVYTESAVGDRVLCYELAGQAEPDSKR